MFNYFNCSTPPLRKKRVELIRDSYPANALWTPRIVLGSWKVEHGIYTRVDRACSLWAVLLLAIFGSAQLCPISWTTLSVVWSAASVVALGITYRLCYGWTQQFGVVWALHGWAIAIGTGIICTDWAIFSDCTQVLARVNQLSLLLESAGYLGTGIAVRSRAIIAIATLHGIAALMLELCPKFQYAIAGGVMAAFLAILAEMEWDKAKAPRGEN